MVVRFPIRASRRNESGYVMLTLLLVMALMAIFAGVIVSSITFDIKRDREEEMIHRGVQYSRAIRAYYKKFSRYPAKIEDLENTSQMRFLRKRYKDPLTGKDFKLLHYGEAKLSLNALGGGAGIAGASTIGANGSLTAAGGLGQPSAFGASGTLGATSNSAFGQNSQTTNQAAAGTQTGSDPNQPGQGSTDGTNAAPTGPGGSGPSNGISGISSGALGSATFGGAPIVGVASLSKDRTIREFDHKKKYDEWQFVYDPTFDRGFLITTPYQPSLQQFGMQGNTNLNGQNGQNGSQPGTSGFGNSFGTSPSPMQNNPTSPVGGYGNTNQPASPPQQQ